jgi:hypothetical protein
MSLKPELNDCNLLNGLYYWLSKFFKSTTTAATRMKYSIMYNKVCISENQFYLVKDGGQYIQTADEVPPPTITVAPKSHIMKVILLSALARLQYIYTN